MNETLEQATPVIPSAPAPVGIASEIADILEGHDEAAIAVADSRPVQEELQGEKILTTATRTGVRLLLLTYNDVFTEGSVAAQELVTYGALFEEVHVIVYTRDRYDFVGIQLAPNVWAYPTNSRSKWFYLFDAYRVAKRQLYFAGSFHADVVSAHDAFELGLGAYLISRWYSRGLHLEMPVNMYAPTFPDREPENQYRMWMATFVLPKATRIRVFTTTIKDELIHRYPERTGTLDVIPRIIDTKGARGLAPAIDLRQMYPQFSFPILVSATMENAAALTIAVDAAQYILRQYPSVGMVIMGEFTDRAALETYIRTKGLGHKIFVIESEKEIFSSLKTASLLCAVGNGEYDEQLFIAAAVASVPVLAPSTGSAVDLFVSGESALLCAPNDIGCYIQALGRFLSDNAFRVSCAAAAQENIMQHADSTKTLIEYRDSIEKSFAVNDEVEVAVQTTPPDTVAVVQ